MLAEAATLMFNKALRLAQAMEAAEHKTSEVCVALVQQRTGSGVQ